MTARLLVFSSVTILILSSLTGCYTAFRGGDLEQKATPAGNTVSGTDRDTEFNGYMSFSAYNNDRWSFYLGRPWWEESLLLQWTGHAGGESQQPTPQPIYLPGPDQSAGYTKPLPVINGPGVEIPSTPTKPAGSSSKGDGTDVRYKDDSDTSTNSSADSNSTIPTDRKPARRKTTGGKK